MKTGELEIRLAEKGMLDELIVLRKLIAAAIMARGEIKYMAERLGNDHHMTLSFDEIDNALQ